MLIINNEILNNLVCKLFINFYLMCNIYVFYRYEGESKEEVENETNHFAELLKRIEDRKKQRAAANNKVIPDVDQNNSNKHQKKRKKTRLDSDETNDSHIEVKSESNEKINDQTKMVKTSTKKKRKKKDTESTPTSTQENKELEGKDDAKNLANGKEDNDTTTTTEKKISLQNNFVVLGTKSRKKQREVKRVLPDWLAHPEVISADLNSGPSLEEFNSILDAELIEVLKANDIVKLFPVQSSIIKWLHKCNMDRKLGRWLRDTCVSAPTGSGKLSAINNIF